MIFEDLVNRLVGIKNKYPTSYSAMVVTANKINGKSFLVLKENGCVVECICLMDDKFNAPNGYIKEGSNEA